MEDELNELTEKKLKSALFFIKWIFAIMSFVLPFAFIYAVLSFITWDIWCIKYTACRFIILFWQAFWVYVCFVVRKDYLTILNKTKELVDSGMHIKAAFKSAQNKKYVRL